MENKNREPKMENQKWSFYFFFYKKTYNKKNKNGELVAETLFSFLQRNGTNS